jgi:hypothetical protein
MKFIYIFETLKHFLILQCMILSMLLDIIKIIIRNKNLLAHVNKQQNVEIDSAVITGGQGS